MTPLEAAFRRDARRVLDLAPALLARLAARAAHADAFLSHTLERQLVLRRRHARRASPPAERERHRAGLGLRAWNGGPQRLAAGPASTAEALTDALLTRLDGPGCDALPFAAPALPAAPPGAPCGTAPAERAAVLEAALDAAMGADPRVRHASATLHERQRHALVVATDGRAAATVGTHVALRVDVVLRIDGADVSAYATSGGAQLADVLAHAPERVAAAAIGQALHAAAATPWQAESAEVVLGPGWGGVWLHEAVGHALEADVAAHGGLDVAAGTRIAPPGIRVTDGPEREGRCREQADDEGWPAQTTVLVDDGRLAGRLTDAFSAQRLGMPRTGNGRRADFAAPVLPRMTNLRLGPGEAAADELLHAATGGLYVSRLGRGHVHPGGRFRLEVLAGHRIEGGRPGAPVAGVWIEGDAARSLASLGGVGRDVRAEPGRGLCEKQGQVLPVGIAMPSVWLRGLRVGQSPR